LRLKNDDFQEIELMGSSDDTRITGLKGRNVEISNLKLQISKRGGLDAKGVEIC
jgi:hypothetical protein